MPPDAPQPDREGTLDDLLGLEVAEAGGGRAKGSFEVGKRVMQPFGLVHGGAYAAHAEALASVGTWVEVKDDGMLAMGMSNFTTFLRPVFGGTINAEARALHRGRSTWVWDVEFVNEEGKPCASSRVTIAVRAAPG
ncbi:MAG: PaaI family thioesterase [Thermoleophilaceae bacterium]|nr:PaaI family thioesterase [Thermoleophilaceae bacterium]